MSDIKATLDKLNEQKANAQIDLTSKSPQTRPGFEAKKNKALSTLPQLRLDYRAALRKGMSVTLVVGPEEKKAKFLEVVEDEGSSVVVPNASALYEDLARLIEPTMGGRYQWTAHQHARLINEMSVIMQKYGILEMDAPTLMAAKTLKGFDELVSVVKNHVYSVVDAQFTALEIEEVAFSEAEEINYDSPILSVVVFGVDERDVELLAKYFDSLYVIDLDKSAATKTTLINTYKKIKDKSAPKADTAQEEKSKEKSEPKTDVAQANDKEEE